MSWGYMPPAWVRRMTEENEWLMNWIGTHTRTDADTHAWATDALVAYVGRTVTEDDGNDFSHLWTLRSMPKTANLIANHIRKCVPLTATTLCIYVGMWIVESEYVVGDPTHSRYQISYRVMKAHAFKNTGVRITLELVEHVFGMISTRCPKSASAPLAKRLSIVRIYPHEVGDDKVLVPHRHGHRQINVTCYAIDTRIKAQPGHVTPCGLLWTPQRHAGWVQRSVVHRVRNQLLGTCVLGLQRLRETGVLEGGWHDAVVEGIFECMDLNDFVMVLDS